jgi:CBS-domain-containing membrane protein
MRLFDKKARRNIRPYFIQCSLATLTIVLILVFLDVIKHAAIIATLGSSVFLIFALPSTYPSRPRPLLGGYLIAIIIGPPFLPWR